MIIINYEDAFPTNDGFRTEGVGLMCSSNHPLQWVSMTRHGSLKDFLDVFWSPPSAHRTGHEFVPRAFPGISFLFYESARDWLFLLLENFFIKRRLRDSLRSLCCS